MSNLPELEDLVVVGRKFNLRYELGKKDLGEVKIVALHSNTMQVISTLTSNTLWLPNPLSGSVGLGLDMFTTVPTYIVYEDGKVIYTYEFLPLENSDEIFSGYVVVSGSSN